MEDVLLITLLTQQMTNATTPLPVKRFVLRNTQMETAKSVLINTILWLTVKSVELSQLKLILSTASK